MCRQFLVTYMETIRQCFDFDFESLAFVEWVVRTFLLPPVTGRIVGITYYRVNIETEIQVEDFLLGGIVDEVDGKSMYHIILCNNEPQIVKV